MDKKQLAALRKQLEDLGITRVMIAETAETSPSMVSKVLHGKAISAPVMAAVDLCISRAKAAKSK